MPERQPQAPQGAHAPTFRAGTVAILGRPNVGKSTLLNRLLGEKLAAVTPKPQTTRDRLLGILNRPEAQVALVDTPGLHEAKGGLNRYMVSEAMAAAEDADVLLVLVEAPRAPADTIARRGVDPGRAYGRLLERLKEGRRPLVLAINKVDLVRDKPALLPFIDAWMRLAPFAAIVPISALDGSGIDRLIDEIVAVLPEGPPLFPEDMLTDRTERFLAGESIREQAFLLTRQEVPYALAVEIDRFEERPGESGGRKDIVIDATLFVERESQRGILIGKGGQMIKEIGTRARHAIAELCGCPVHVKLDVKVEPDWSRNPRMLRELGYRA